MNPLFPFYNNIFKSPFISAEWHFPYLEPFMPKDFLEYVTWPLIFSANSKRVAENSFFDIRFGLVYFLFVVWVLRSIFNRSPSKSEGRFLDPQVTMFLLGSFCLSFVLWMKVFSYYRYLMCLELLSPIIFIILLERTFNSYKAQLAIGVLAALLVFITFVPLEANFISWTDQYFEVDLSPLPSRENAIVLLLGSSPMGYVIPFAPPQIRFFRPDWNYVPGEYQTLLYSEIEVTLRKHEGLIYVLYNEDSNTLLGIDENLRRFDLRTLPMTCTKIRTNMSDSLSLCKLSTARYP